MVKNMYWPTMLKLHTVSDAEQLLFAQNLCTKPLTFSAFHHFHASFIINILRRLTWATFWAI